jgi:hypothetical protein
MDQVSEGGTIKPDDFQGGTLTAQQQLTDFITAMRAGGTYVVLDGEIRGQVARPSVTNNTRN